MINQARCQRRIYKKTFGRTISEKAYLSTKFINPQKNKLFEYYINRYGVTRAFSIGYDWLAMICGVGRTTVKKWINDFVKAGFIKKEVRYSSLMKKNYTNTYRITLYLKMIMTALLPLMPSLYSFGNNGHSKYISSCLSELKTALLFNDLSVHADKDKSLYLSYIRKRRYSEEIRNASLSLLAVGPQNLNGSNMTWVRGNAPQLNNSLVEKEREMSEDYEALRETEHQERLDRKQEYWRDPQLNAPRVPSHKKVVQNPASNVNNPIKGNAIRATTQNTNVNVPPRHEVGADGMITVNGKKFLPQRIGNEWKPTPDFVVNRDVSGVERPAFEKMWEDPEVQAKAKKVGIVGYAGRSFFEEFIVPQMKERD